MFATDWKLPLQRNRLKTEGVSIEFDSRIPKIRWPTGLYSEHVESWPIGWKAVKTSFYGELVGDQMQSGCWGEL